MQYFCTFYTSLWMSLLYMWYSYCWVLGIITLGINNDIPGHGFADLPLLLRFSQILYIYDSQNVLIFHVIN